MIDRFEIQVTNREACIIELMNLLLLIWPLVHEVPCHLKRV